MEIPIVYEVSSSAKKAATENSGSPGEATHFEFPTPTPR